MSASIKYRPDVDGLRAIAVIPVVFFHAGFSHFQGGFVGVDVFFVVSGYLITSLILPEAVEGKFSIVRFYERRIRRIFPAVFSVMLALLLAGYWLMLPVPFNKFAESVVAATFFASNFLFWRQSGYFDSPAESKPLLHTWSLAVEEQFYIFFPIYLLVVARWFPSLLKRLTIVIAVLSFSLSLYGVAYKPSAAFYLAPTRGWELLLGALLAMKVFDSELSSMLRDLLCLTGLALIGWSVFFFSKSTPFPGGAALIPCLGTALVIYSGSKPNAYVSQLLCLRPLVFVGLISYSLYLWHWPLLLFTRFYLVRPLRLAEIWGVILSSFLLAALSWKFIEQPFRHRKITVTRKSVFVFAVASMTVTAVIGSWVLLKDGLPDRLPHKAVILAAVAKDCSESRNRCNSLSDSDIRLDNLCRLGNAPRADFLLWGDSHAEALSDSFAEAAASIGRSGLQATTVGCPPILGITRLDNPVARCVEFNNAVLNVAADPSLRQVFLVSRWSLWAEGSRYRYEPGIRTRIADVENSTGESSNQSAIRRGLKRTLDALTALGKEVVIVAPVPEVGWDVPSVLGMESWQGRKIHSEPQLSEFLARNRFMLELFAELQPAYGFKLVYPHEILCNGTLCQVRKDEQPLYCDDDHLSLRGRKLLAPIFAQTLNGVSDKKSGK